MVTKKNILRLSASAVGAYMWCPLKYKFRYIDKIKSDIKIPHLIKGIDIHSAIEKFYNTIPDEGGITLDFIKNHKKSFGKSLYDKYPEHFDNFIDLNKKIFLDLDEKDRDKFFKPVAIEQKIFDKNLGFVGIIDAVYFDGKNYLILDFKTGKPHKTLTVDDRFQLAGYKHLWDFMNPDKKISYWCHFYTADSLSEKNPLIKEATEKDMIAMHERIENVRDSILCEHFPKTKNNYFCGSCEYLERCVGVDL